MTGSELIKQMLERPDLLNCKVVLREENALGPWRDISIEAGTNIFIINKKYHPEKEHIEHIKKTDKIL